MADKLPPKEAVRGYCMQCLGLRHFKTEAIRDCLGDQAFICPCPLFPYRLGKRVSVKQLREYCLYCMGRDRNAVSKCPTLACSLYPYRFGKNPSREGLGMHEEAMKSVREQG